MRIATVTSLALLLAAGSAFAQDEAATKMKMEAAAGARVPLEMPTKGAPYSADTITEAVQVLADGNRIVRRTTGRVYRDNEGRTRREEDHQGVSRDVPYVPSPDVTISIVDPVAGYSYSLDPENKIAWRTPTGAAAGIMLKLQAAEQKQKLEEEQLVAAKREAEARQREGGAGGGAPVSGNVMVRRRGGDVAVAYTPEGPIEHKTIDGLNVDGRKTTTTIPAGAIGNEQPLTITSEEWRSPELGVLVLTRHSDPRSGDSSYRLTNIVRAEPDPSLFMVPPDYTVKDTNVRRPLELSQRK